MILKYFYYKLLLAVYLQKSNFSHKFNHLHSYKAFIKFAFTAFYKLYVVKLRYLVSVLSCTIHPTADRLYIEVFTKI